MVGARAANARVALWKKTVLVFCAARLLFALVPCECWLDGGDDIPFFSFYRATPCFDTESLPRFRDVDVTLVLLAFHGTCHFWGYNMITFGRDRRSGIASLMNIKCCDEDLGFHLACVSNMREHLDGDYDVCVG